MVPWPIALLTIFYGAIASLSAATVWQVVSGTGGRALIWPAMWLALSAGVMFGLPLLKAWARRLAIVASVLLMLSMLGVAVRVVMAGRPLIGLVATVGAAVHVIIIRYLQRPAVKAYFAYSHNT